MLWDKFSLRRWKRLGAGSSSVAVTNARSPPSAQGIKPKCFFSLKKSFNSHNANDFDYYFINLSAKVFMQFFAYNIFHTHFYFWRLVAP